MSYEPYLFSYKNIVEDRAGSSRSEPIGTLTPLVGTGCRKSLGRLILQVSLVI